MIGQSGRRGNSGSLARSASFRRRCDILSIMRVLRLAIVWTVVFGTAVGIFGAAELTRVAARKVSDAFMAALAAHKIDDAFESDGPRNISHDVGLTRGQGT